MLVYLQNMWVIVPGRHNLDIPNKNEKYEAHAIPKPVCPVKTRSLRPGMTSILPTSTQTPVKLDFSRDSDEEAEPRRSQNRALATRNW